jgi:hypothetical protein
MGDVQTPRRRTTTTTTTTQRDPTTTSPRRPPPFGRSCLVGVQERERERERETALGKDLSNQTTVAQEQAPANIQYLPAKAGQQTPRSAPSRRRQQGRAQPSPSSSSLGGRFIFFISGRQPSRSRAISAAVGGDTLRGHSDDDEVVSERDVNVRRRTQSAAHCPSNDQQQQPQPQQLQSKHRYGERRRDRDCR